MSDQVPKVGRYTPSFDPDWIKVTNVFLLERVKCGGMCGNAIRAAVAEYDRQRLVAQEEADHDGAE